MLPTRQCVSRFGPSLRQGVMMLVFIIWHTLEAQVANMHAISLGPSESHKSSFTNTLPPFLRTAWHSQMSFTKNEVPPHCSTIKNIYLHIFATELNKLQHKPVEALLEQRIPKAFIMSERYLNVPFLGSGTLRMIQETAESQ